MDEQNYQTKVLYTINETLIEQWRELWGKGENANIFNSYEWFLTCQNVFNIKDYEIYVCFRNNVPIGILPVINTRVFGITTASAVGSRYIAETPFLVDKYDPDLIKSLFCKIIENRNIYITKIDKRTIVILKKAFPNLFVSLASVNPYLEADRDPLRYISKSNLSSIKRRMRKYENQLSLEIHNSRSDLSKYLEKMFEIEQKSSKKRRGMDLFSKKENRALYRNLIKLYGQFITICFLMYKAEPIAYSFSFLYKRTFFFFQMAYLYEYRKLSPGKVMTLLLLKKLHKNSINYFDFGGGISSYKQEFTPNYYFQYNVYYSKNIFIRGWWKLINFARRMNQILFPKKNTRDHEFLFKTL